MNIFIKKNFFFQFNTLFKYNKKAGLRKANKGKKPTQKKNNKVGFVVKVFDEIVYCIGLPNISLGEIVIMYIKGAPLQGLVINIKSNITSCVFFTNTKYIQPGMYLEGTGKPMYVKVDVRSLGNLVDCLGYPIIRGDSSTNTFWAPTERVLPWGFYKTERPAPGITLRQSIYQPLHTGNILVDSLFPIGRGQRELILGDRQTGKTTVAINSIRSQRYDTLIKFFKKRLYCIYVAIGQKKSNIVKLFFFLLKEICMDYTVILSVSASESASLQYLAPYSGCAIAEYFRDRGQDTLVIYDDLSKQAVAFRQISLLLRRPPGREAYPGDIFYLHARLLERASKLSKKFMGGSLTALPVVETLVGDITSYIPTNVISITDGQIFLDNQIFNKYYKPAVNIELSVSRVGSKAQVKLYRKISKVFRNWLLKFILVSGKVNLGSSSEDHSKKILMDIGSKLFLIINHREPLCIELQVFFLILVFSGLLKNLSATQCNTLVKKLTRKYSKKFNLNLKFFKDLDMDGLLACFSELKI